MNVKTTKLSNGFTVITDYMPHLKSVALGVWVNAGSRSEDDHQHGLAHLLEHMAFKGTQRRTAASIAQEIEAVGGELNAATSIENTAYYARILSDDVPLAVDILADILQNSTLDEEELSKEQHVILQEIGASLDMPEDLVYDRFQETAFKGQKIGRPILGTPDSITSFTPSAIKTYLDRHYCAQNMILSAAGDVQHEDLVQLAQQKFNHLPVVRTKKSLETANYTGGQWIEDRSLQEAQILLGFEGCTYFDEDFFTVQVLAAVLGGGMSSRLFQEVREKRGLCYSVYAFHWAYSDTGIFGIHAATGKEDIKQLMPVILDELEKISYDITDEEVARAKAQLRSHLLMSLESPSSRAAQLARHTLLFNRQISPCEQEQKINAVRISDMKKLAKWLFTSSNPTLSAIGPIKDMMSVDDIVARMSLKQAAE